MMIHILIGIPIYSNCNPDEVEYSSTTGTEVGISLNDKYRLETGYCRPLSYLNTRDEAPE